MARPDSGVEAGGVAIAVRRVDADHVARLAQLCWPEDTLVAALVAGGGEHEHVVHAGRADGGKDGAESLVELREAEGEVNDIDAVVVIRREVLDGLLR